MKFNIFVTVNGNELRLGEAVAPDTSSLEEWVEDNLLKDDGLWIGEKYYPKHSIQEISYVNTGHDGYMEDEEELDEEHELESDNEDLVQLNDYIKTLEALSEEQSVEIKKLKKEIKKLKKQLNY
jgi:hypothetical protein